MRRLVLLSLPLLAAAAVPAAAGPVETSRLAVASFAVPTYGGDELRVEVRAVDGVGEDLVRVAVRRCEGQDCAFPRYYRGALPAGALRLSSDAASGHLDAVLGGLAVDVTWTPDAGDPSVVIGGVEGGGSDADSSVATYNARPANARVTLPGGSCAGRGAVGDEARVSTGAGDGSAAPLSRLRLRALGGPACGT